MSSTSAPPSAPARSGSVAPPVSAGPVTLETPHVSGTPAGRKHLGYKPGQARLRRRLLALIIDGLVCIPLILPCLFVTSLLGVSRAGIGFLYLAACLLYFFLLELRTGQTVGKRLAGLRVVRVDGNPVDVMGIGARTGLRLIDGIPGIPLVGALSMTLTGERRRRIGDLGGRTMVVEADEHPFVRGAWSPLIVIYPLLWSAMAIAAVLLIGTAKEPYLAKVDAICRARVEAQSRGSTPTLANLVALSHEETRMIGALQYPPNLYSTRDEVLTLKYRVDNAADAVLRDMQASGDPRRTWAREGPQLQAVAAQVNARFDAMGLHYCAQ
jgi:uncharacterized RDD family membrane protein YckC